MLKMIGFQTVTVLFFLMMYAGGVRHIKIIFTIILIFTILNFCEEIRGLLYMVFYNSNSLKIKCKNSQFLHQEHFGGKQFLSWGR